VTYVRNPTMDFAAGQLTADHAYWLSGITLRDGSGAAPLGTVDVRSRGFGEGDPAPSGVTNGAGVLIGGQAPMPYACESQSWGPGAPAGTCEAQSTAAPAAPVRDELDIEATNISDVTVNARRARVTCNAEQNITSDGPVAVHMVDCPGVPTLSVADVSHPEGDSGQTDMTFTVTLSANGDNLPVSAHYQTADGTADSGGDYEAVSGTLTFEPGETAKAITVPVNGDVASEGDETLTLELSDVQFATPSSVSATGTIVDDDFDGYPRPKSASPLYLSLVPAYEPCTAPNRTHGPPLDSPSCNPPQQTSSSLTVGTADSNGRPTQSAGSIRIAAVPGPPGPPFDQADVVVTGQITDVRRQSDLADYTGEVEVASTLRITDRWNATGSGGGSDPATVIDIPFPIPGTCAATSNPSIGATCSVSTGFNALVPGAVAEGRRSIWQLDQVAVHDGGADGDRETAPNTVLARQGVFVP
jgi:Calx-beta domain